MRGRSDDDIDATVDPQVLLPGSSIGEQFVDRIEGEDDVWRCDIDYSVDS